MKINGQPILPVESIQSTQRVNKMEKKQKVSAGKDEVELSNSGQVFQNLLEKTKNIPNIRMDKVTLYQKQIQQGQFNLDSKSIAESLLTRKTGK